jgi:hypothetical protein
MPTDSCWGAHAPRVPGVAAPGHDRAALDALSASQLRAREKLGSQSLVREGADSTHAWGVCSPNSYPQPQLRDEQLECL